MTYTKDELSLLSYKELQKLCKQTKGHVKANKKTSELVCDLAEYYEKEESEMMEMEAEMKKYEEYDLNGTWTLDDLDDGGCEKNNSPSATSINVSKNQGDQEKDVENLNSSYTLSDERVTPADDEVNSDQENKENNDKLKQALMQEVDRRAEEKLSKIPRLFVAEKVHIPAKIGALATPELKKKGVGSSTKTGDSIDVYLEKKQKRAEGCLKFVSERNKENIVKTVKPSSCLPKPGTGKRKSVKIDKEVTINFAPQIKSTPNPGKRSSPRLSLMNEAANKRKSVTALNKSATDGRRFTVGGISTPTSSKCPTPKFDLQESLKKPLKYKPHTGKLKDVYFNNNKKGALFSRKADSKPGTNTTKLSLKEMSKTVSTRDKRRQNAADQRSQSRNNALDKRRGIIC